MTPSNRRPLNPTLPLAAFLLAILALAAFPAATRAQTLNAAWVELSPATSPPSRLHSAMAYDATHREIVLFGGEAPGGARLNDTWTWDGTTWTEQHPATSPPARFQAMMAYDAANGQILLFGGSSTSGLLNDTWSWNGTNWIEEHPATSPSETGGAEMVYDAAHEQIVLFGVQGNETWTWNGSNWTQMSPTTSPPAPTNQTMAFDASQGAVVLYENNKNLGETWVWDGANWTPQSFSGPILFNAIADYDTYFGQMILVGENSGGSYDTYGWNGTIWTWEDAPGNLTYVGGFQIAYDAEHNEEVVSGSYYSDSDGNLDETWVYTPSTSITSPKAASTLAGASVTFSWPAALGATSYTFLMGSTGAGSYDIVDSRDLTATSATLNYLPTNGKTLYVRLLTYYVSGYLYSDYTYTAANQAAMISPGPGTVFTSTSQTFNWTTASGATSYVVWIGTMQGAHDIASSGAITSTSATLNNFPNNGETIYVRLYTDFGSKQLYIDYTYTASDQAALTSPASGATFTSASQTFNWTAAGGASSYALWIGTTQGAHDVASSGVTTATSSTLTNLPVNGEKLWARMWTNFSSRQLYNDYTYTAANITPAVLSSPTPGTTFNNVSETFTWNAAPQATSYVLWIGSTGVGSHNLATSGTTTALSYADKSLPTNGEKVYVRLYTNFGAQQLYNDYVYTAATLIPAEMTTPSQGSTLSGATQTFNWSAAPGSSGYVLWIGSTGIGTHDLGSSGTTTATSHTFTNLPTNGEIIWVRLFTNFGNNQVYQDYTYTAQ